MELGPLLRGRGPLVDVHGLTYASCEFIDFGSKAYRLLSERYEAKMTMGVQELLEQIGAISFGEWRHHPSQCRRLSQAVLNTTMILQSIVGDERDLQSVLNQKKVTLGWRDEQRQQLRKFVKLKAVERTDFLEDEVDRVASGSTNSSEKADSSTVKQPNYKFDSDWDKFSLNDLPM